jgi:hypothetical protein
MEIRLSPRNPAPLQPRPGDSLRIGPVGEILLEWKTDTGQIAQRRIPRRNRVIPSVGTVVELLGGGRSRYSYTVTNGPSARQNIVLFTLGVSRPDLTVQSSDPLNWYHLGTRPDLPRWFMGSTSREGDILPGQSKGPFVIEAPLLPGLMEGFFEGYLSEQEASVDADTWDLSPWLLDQLNEALRFENNSVRLTIVGPKIVLAATLDRDHLADTIAGELLAAARSAEFEFYRPLLESVSASLKSTRRANPSSLKKPSTSNLPPLQQSFFSAMEVNLRYLEKMP